MNKVRNKWLGRRQLAVEFLEQRYYLSASGLTIYAVGDVGTENMELLIDGAKVAEWFNVASGGFQPFEYEAEGLAIAQVRIAFTNDTQTSGGPDKNLNIDRVNLYGVDYQVEDPRVFSLGSWDPTNGCAGGFKLSETLHCDGYFDFSGITEDGSDIEIRAAGATGEESLALLIDGVAVRQWDNVGGDYQSGVFESLSYQHSETVTADRIRVSFVNDGLSAAQEDRNLRVDGITVDGQIVESESPETLTTGTWSAANGCGPGFKQSELLHCDGYFHYASESSETSVIEVRAAGSTGSELLGLAIDEQIVATWENVGGDYSGGVFVSRQFDVAAGMTPERVQVHFLNDGTTSSGADRNLRVDGITIDGVTYESEGERVFSTGTWTAGEGCLGGFKQSELLHCGGYLGFADPNAVVGNIALATNSFVVDEDEGSVDVLVQRSGGASGLVAFDYRSVSGTALADEDFVPVAGRGLFADGQTEAVVTIPIIDDQLPEGTEEFSFTIDNVAGGATLLAPRTAIIEIRDESVPPGPGFSFSVTDFDQLTDLTVNGSAAISANSLQLTTNAGSQAGSAFYRRPITLDATTSWDSAFEVRFDQGALPSGDGVTFTVHNAATAENTLGPAGGALGYAGIGSASLAIELDTFPNTFDPNDNHVSVLQGGDVAQSLVAATAPFDIKAAVVNYVWVTYDGSTNSLQAFLADTPVQPATPILTLDVDLAALLGDQMYFGFTAGNGGDAQSVVRWDFSSSSELVAEPASFEAEVILSGLVQPTAIDFSSDSRNLYIAEKGGVVRVVRDGQLLPAPLLDIHQQVNSARDRGLLDIAVHPSLGEHPYLYLLYTYDPPEAQSNTGLAGPDGFGNRAGRLTRIQLDATTNFTTTIPGTETVLLGSNSTWENFNAFANSTIDFGEPPAGINPDGTNLQDFLAADSESHTVGGVEFGDDGALYVSNGDGTSYNQVDPRTVRVQDVDNLSGKVLRIDPISGAGLTDNPFYNGDPAANRSKVFHLGLRNPFRIALEDVTSRVFVGDVGWTQWEEVNQGDPGANFGWPYFEGAIGVAAPTIGYEDLPEAQAFYASGAETEPPLVALSHAADGIDAVVLGDFLGDQYPTEYQGDLLVGELGNGLVRHIRFDAQAGISNVGTFATGDAFVVQMKTGPDGFTYFVNLVQGTVGRWILTPPPGSAAPGGANATAITFDSPSVPGPSTVGPVELDSVEAGFTPSDVELTEPSIHAGDLRTGSFDREPSHRRSVLEALEEMETEDYLDLLVSLRLEEAAWDLP